MDSFLLGMGTLVGVLGMAFLMISASKALDKNSDKLPPYSERKADKVRLLHDWAVEYSWHHVHVKGTLDIDHFDINLKANCIVPIEYFYRERALENIRASLTKPGDMKDIVKQCLTDAYHSALVEAEKE
jgi:hypothetical protein